MPRNDTSRRNPALKPALAGVAAALLTFTGTGAAYAQTAGPASMPISADSQPAPRLFVDPPLPGPLATYGAATLPFRVENIQIAPVFGAAANDVTPRIGHLHVTVDDLPWHWATATSENFIAVAPLSPGRHSVRIEVAAPDHRVLTGQTVTFTVPESASHAH